MRTTGSMIVGVAVLALSLAAWLYGETHGINTDILWTIVPALLIALFIGAGVAQAGTFAQQAAQQTNGALDARIAQGVAIALGNRDKARTRQAQGDTAPSSADVEPAESSGA